MVPRLAIDPPVCFWLVLGILILPLNWLLAAIAAALFHELCHCFTAFLLRIPIHQMAVGLFGCRLYMGPMTNLQELLCALAGPVGSLLLTMFADVLPRMTICAAVQGIFNLIPIYPLDGGRVLRVFLRCVYTDETAANICEFTESMCLLVLLGGSAILSSSFSLGPIPVIAALILCLRVFKAKNTLQTDRTQSTIEIPFFKR